MKRSVICFFSTLTKLLLVALGIWLCFHFYQRARGEYHTPAPVGLVQNTPVAYLNVEGLSAALEEGGFPFLSRQTGDNEADVRALLEQGVKFLLVSLGQGQEGTAAALIRQAQSAQAVILFLGLPPAESDLDGYDKAWYLGARPAYGGEVMGEALAQAFRAGTLRDQNSDGLLQYRIYDGEDPDFSDALTAFTLEECEHYGVFSALYVPGAGAVPQGEETDSLAGLDEFERQLLAQQQQQALEEAENLPELLLCVGAENQAAALGEMTEYGWSSEEQRPYLAAFAYNRQQAQALAQDSGAVVYYDQQEATRLAALFVQNIESGEALEAGTGYFPDGRFFMVPYQLFE